jgi:hypothetical protein
MGKAQHENIILTMKKIFIFIALIVTVCTNKSFATAQLPDILIYNADTLSIFSNPLELLYGNDTIRPLFFGLHKGCSSTACWRGYQAKWMISHDTLYLTGIYSCCYYRDSIKADLKELFGNKYVNGKVKADWVTDYIISPQGKLLYYVHMGYESLYEKELEFQFKDGILIETKLYDNSRSRQSVYSHNDTLLLQHIYKNINWAMLPEIEENNVKVIARFSANEDGIIDSVQIMKGYNETYDKEAIRVIKSIPDWDVYFRHGHYERKYWTLPICFCLDWKKKYIKD